jgi:hypothetical protein
MKSKREEGLAGRLKILERSECYFVGSPVPIMILKPNLYSTVYYKAIYWCIDVSECSHSWLARHVFTW